MRKESRDHRWYVRHSRRLKEAGMDHVKLEGVWLDVVTRGRPKWRDHMKVTIVVISDTVYDMNASTNYHPLGTRWPYVPPKRTPLIKKGGKP